MKKKLGYIFLIIISIVGSKLIFGRDYHLNRDMLVNNNLYVYDIFGSNKVLSYFIDGQDLYYVSESPTNNQYDIVRYNLNSNKRISYYKFNSGKALNGVRIFKNSGNVYLTSLNDNVYYKLNSNLALITKDDNIDENYDSYGIYKDSFIYTIDNKIYIDGEVYETLPVSCGKNKEIIYDKDTYVHFHNYETGFGCLYNINDKKREYLDYENIDIVNNRFLEYQDNSLSFKYDGNIYYFNDISESNSLKMRVNGDYLFAVDNTKNNLNIYNLDTSKIIYQRNLSEIKGAIIGEIEIDDYVYFLVIKDGKYQLFIWDYLQETRVSKDMLSYNEKEYKFKNNEIKEEIKKDYNIDVYFYDQGIKYFSDFYVIPSYDDILINSRLNTLRDVLKTLNGELFSKIDLNIYFDKEIIFNNNQINRTSYPIISNNEYDIVFQITNDNFKENLMYELFNLLKKDQKDMLNKWSSYNDINFAYGNNLEDYDIIPNKNAYFIDLESKKSILEDEFRIFLNLTNEEILKYPNILLKAKYLEEELVKYYPVLEDALIFQNINK